MTFVSARISKLTNASRSRGSRPQGHDGAITVSTLAEARAFAKHGFTDITYAVPIERGKFEDAIEIVNSGVKLNLLTDDAATVKALDEAAGRSGLKFDVFLKIDCGTHRVGVDPERRRSDRNPAIDRGICKPGRLQAC